MKKLIIAVILAILIVSLLACEDEINPVIVDNNPDYLIYGLLIMRHWEPQYQVYNIRPYIDFYGNIFPVKGQQNDFDSVIIGDSACTVGKAEKVALGDYYSYAFKYQNIKDSMRFISGDTVNIELVRDDESIAVPLKIINWLADSIVINTPEEYSVFDLDEDMIIEWDKNEAADWYSIRYVIDTSDIQGLETISFKDFTTDTSYTVPATRHGVNGDYYFYISSVTGPVPGEIGNIQSDNVIGSLYCWGIPGILYPYVIIAGSGSGENPNPTKFKYEISTEYLMNNYVLGL